MEDRMFIDVHVIQTVPPSCINRDDTGTPKTCQYGGVRRARVSSQSWKRAVRTEFGKRFDESQLSVRTKHIDEMVAERIRKKDASISEEDAKSRAIDILEKAGVKIKTKKEGVQEAGALFFLSSKQADNLASLAIENCEDKKMINVALKKENGVDIALFGRMVADDPTLNEDASVQVAHAISTHKVDPEYDYYTAMDERSPKNNVGAAMIGTTEFDSATFYRYATVSVHDLIKKLEDDATVTARVVGEFIRAFVMSMPTGKMNAFANRTVPYVVLIVVRSDQPVNLVSAFESPVAPGSEGGYTADSVKRLVREFEESCSSFVDKPVRTWQIGRDIDNIGTAQGLNDAISEIEDFVRGEH